MILTFLLLQHRRSIRHRHFLTRDSLHMPHSSAWQRLLRRRDDRAFVNTMSLTYDSFQGLHDILVNRGYLDVDVRHCLLDTRGVLALSLHYLNSTMLQKTLCETFGLTPAACSRLIWRGLRAMQRAFQENAVPSAVIRWPSPAQMEAYSQQIINRHPLLAPHRPFAFIDGLRLPMFSPGDDPIIQNAYYSGKEKCCCVGNVICFAPDGTIIWWRGNCPGSWHDITIASRFLEGCRDHLPRPFTIIADSGFKRFDLINSCLLVSRTPNAVAFGEYTAEEFDLNQSITSARQAAEWGMRTVRGSFGRLRIPLPVETDRRECILTVCMHLANFKTRTVGINQITTVYEQENIQ